MRLLPALAVSTLIACSSSRPVPEPSHTGWTVRYTARHGEGASDPRDVRPGVTLAVLDGRAEATVAESNPRARIDGAHHRAQLCRNGACTAAGYDVAWLSIAQLEALAPLVDATESDPTMESIADPLVIAGVTTTGARFSGTLRSGRIGERVSIEVRWIDQPGEVSVETAKDFFLAPVIRLGLSHLADEIRRTAGLPLAWELRMTTSVEGHADQESALRFTAAELGNPPARVDVVP